MKISNKMMKTAVAVFAVLAAALGFFRLNMLKSGAIDALGLYTDKASGNLFGALTFILLALTVVFAFLLSKNSFEEKRRSAVWTVSSLLCALLMLTVGISSAAKLLDTPDTVLSAYENVTSGFDILLAIETVLVFVSVVYFFTETVKKGKSNGILALFPVIYLAVRTIRLFMNIETQINSSARSFTLMFLIVTMMFFLYEAQYSAPLGSLEKTDEESSKRAAKYVGFGIASVELAIIFVLMPAFATGLTAYELAVCLSDISLALFAAVRVFSVKTKEL